MKSRWAAIAGGSLAIAAGAGGDTVALWLFDEPAGKSPGAVLADAGPKGFSLVLDRDGEIVPGKFGRALRPAAPDSRRSPARTAGAVTTGDARLRREPWANVTDSRLNLGAHDWTIECWLQLDADAAEEGVVLEIGSGPRGAGEWVTRFSVLPRESAFLFSSLARPAAAGGLAARVELPSPDGPRAEPIIVQPAVLAVEGGPLPRGGWMHVALVHAAAAQVLRLFIDGEPRAVVAARPLALPRGAEAYVSVGRDGRGGRPLGGAVDELRVSDHAVYEAAFVAPGSFSVAAETGRANRSR